MKKNKVLKIVLIVLGALVAGPPVGIGILAAGIVLVNRKPG